MNFIDESLRRNGYVKSIILFRVRIVAVKPPFVASTPNLHERGINSMVALILPSLPTLPKTRFLIDFDRLASSPREGAGKFANEDREKHRRALGISVWISNGKAALES